LDLFFFGLNSRLITLILRHKPEIIGITLDEQSCANVRDLIDGVDVFGSHHLDMEVLCEIERTDKKQWYSFNVNARILLIHWAA